MKKIISFILLILFVTGTILLSFSSFIVRADAVYPYNGIITADSLVIYKGSTTSSGVLTELVYGTSVEVLADASTNFYKISFDNGTIGYTWKSYVTNVDSSRLTTNSTSNGIESYTDYCNSLVSKGFEQSYCPYLYYLHNKYPNWKFEADKTGYSLDEVASNEVWKVVLQTANSNYWISSSPIESNYYYVNKTVIASFMDPRNSLFENTIFQFLDLERSKDIVNDEALKNVSGSNGNLSKYLNEFKVAASTNGINPVHIMSRSRQEGANDASYAAVSGIYSDTYERTSTQGYSLNGYYNFYNIGSYADNNYKYTVQRGLAYAAGFIGYDSCLTVSAPSTATSYATAYYDETKCEPLSFQRPWNTPAKAISGGAEFIADGYVKQGQDTLYYQKFNVSSYSKYDKFTHQYMTNIHAPVEESKKMYSAYAAGNLLNSEFIFVIPVYENMPADNYQAVDKSSNSKLSSITIDDKAFTEFDKDVVEYNYNLVTSNNTFRIGAKTEDSLSSVSGTGSYTFVNGVAKVELVVTAEDGSSTKYVINVKKVSAQEVVTVNQIVGNMGVKINGTTMYGISPDTAVSTLVNTVTKNKGEAVVYDTNGKIKSSGSFATGDKITIKGTTESVTYTIAVRGDINGDGSIKVPDLILVQSHILNKKAVTGIYFYAADLNYDGVVKINDLILIQSHILNKQLL